MSHFMKPPARPAPKAAPVVPAPAAPASTKPHDRALLPLLMVIGVLGLVLMFVLAGDAGTLWGVIVIAWLLAPWVCMPIWSKKGGHPFTGFVMGLMLGPIGYPMLLLTPGTMYCANCGQRIKRVAKVCPFCAGPQVKEGASAAEPEPRPAKGT